MLSRVLVVASTINPNHHLIYEKEGKTQIR